MCSMSKTSTSDGLSACRLCLWMDVVQLPTAVLDLKKLQSSLVRLHRKVDPCRLAPGSQLHRNIRVPAHVRAERFVMSHLAGYPSRGQYQPVRLTGTTSTDDERTTDSAFLVLFVRSNEQFPELESVLFKNQLKQEKASSRRRGQKPVVVLREPVASFQCKEHEAAQDANADDGQRVGGIFGQCGLEDAQDGRDSDGGPAGELVANGGWRGRLEVFRDKAEEYGPFAAAGTSQRGRGNSAQRVQQERARSDSADRIPEQYISALLMEIPTLMHHTSQLMALGSENLLANFRTCLGIIEYWVQHANSVSK
ncbi:conserved hypothetical protein [Culex quinquefasciatus]|uniref:Uncharacterized protein n=1 Tax=Culex quinquefasciatus TaxID=7176 RepID=B0X5E9_CULQU|nr:conserved hypothetical protein [Culex quinquefasciatus]|eukprot:XP_001864871.1 conserved hypothetical protein [Culex quinquefasciatus]